MEIRYPILFIISSVVVLLILLFWKKKKGKYDVGIKVANTSFLEANPYYQKKIKQYKILLGIIKVACLVAIFSSLVLLSRPAKVKTEHPREYNRDIVLCMDVSGSVFDLDYEITENFKDTVAGLKGERIGISLFNSSSVTLLPLTDDYD